MYTIISSSPGGGGVGFLDCSDGGGPGGGGGDGDGDSGDSGNSSLAAKFRGGESGCSLVSIAQGE